MPLHLVASPVSPDLDQLAHDLGEGIASGDITGVGVVVMLKGRRFFVDALGAMARSPHESRGLVAELDDHLREIGHRRRDTATTRL